MITSGAVFTLNLASQIRDMLAITKELCQPTLLVEKTVYTSPLGPQITRVHFRLTFGAFHMKPALYPGLLLVE